MIRRYWREPEFWLWWWRNQVSFGAKLLGLLAVVASASFAVGAMATGGLWGEDAETFPPQPFERTMSVELFIAGFDRVLRADSVLYKRWKELNPAEAAAYERYVDTAASSALPQPVMRTPFGRALIAAATIAAGDATGRLGAKTAPEPS